MRPSFILPWLLVLLTACPEMDQITSADRRYILFATDIEHFHIEKYRHEETREHIPYIFFKAYTEQFGFQGLYGTILISPEGGKVKYLCLVNILPTVEQARQLFLRMSAEPSLSDFGSEEPVAPPLYQADEIYLYDDDTYFHMVLRSARVVYTILLDGTKVEEMQVRSGLKQKIDYLQHNLNAFQ